MSWRGASGNQLTFYLGSVPWATPGFRRFACYNDPRSCQTRTAAVLNLPKGRHATTTGRSDGRTRACRRVEAAPAGARPLRKHAAASSQQRKETCPLCRHTSGRICPQFIRGRVPLGRRAWPTQPVRQHLWLSDSAPSAHRSVRGAATPVRHQSHSSAILRARIPTLCLLSFPSLWYRCCLQRIRRPGSVFRHKSLHPVLD